MSQDKVFWHHFKNWVKLQTLTLPEILENQTLSCDFGPDTPLKPLTPESRCFIQADSADLQQKVLILQ